MARPRTTTFRLDADGLYSTLVELVGRLARAAELAGGLGLGSEPSSDPSSDPARYTAGADDEHGDRVAKIAALIGRRLGLGEERCELLRLASPLHDVGKIGLPHPVGGKPGPLDAAERRTMEEHTEIGHGLLAGSGSPLLELAATIALTHHERWDGAGYPRGLAREEIPLEGRIVSVADVFDALTSERPFRPAFTSEQALRMMQEGRGTLFDPLVVDAFVDAMPEIAAVRGERPRSPRAARERRWRHRRAEPGFPAELDAISPRMLSVAVDEAVHVASATPNHRQALDGAVTALCDGVGPELLASVYGLEHDRLWLVAQHGYDQVRDGFTLDQGVMARALTTGAVQLVPDVSRDPGFVAATRDLRSELAVPLGPRVGVLNLETRRLALTEAAIPIAERLAEALAPRVAALQEDLGTDFASLARLFVHASSLRGTGAIAEFSTRTLARILDLESAQLSLGRSETGYALVSFWARPESKLRALTGAEVERIARETAPGDTACTVLDLVSLGVDLPSSVGPYLVWLPLEVGGDSIGVLVGGSSQPAELDRHQIEAATLFAPHAAALIDVAQTLRREQRAAVTDALTGLLNRRGFEQRFREEIERASRAQRELAVVILDCDGLKEINDRGGHELGDSVLLHVARCLKTQRRSGDIAARLGGDEFAVLLPEIGTDTAMSVAERLRRALVDEVLGDGQLVTATFGIATFPRDGLSPSDLLRAADQALYAAKQAGRNRTELYSRAP